jgi:N-acetylated-alpha-linked acidic dipeptidase
MRAAATLFNARRVRALERAAPPELRLLDDQLIAVERALLDPAGLPGRPWYRHTIFAPKFTYAAEVLPGVAEAVGDGDTARAVRQARRLSAALRRAAAALSGETN